MYVKTPSAFTAHFRVHFRLNFQLDHSFKMNLEVLDTWIGCNWLLNTGLDNGTLHSYAFGLGFKMPDVETFERLHDLTTSGRTNNPFHSYNYRQATTQLVTQTYHIVCEQKKRNFHLSSTSWTLMPYSCSHFYFDIKFSDRLYSKDKRTAWPLLFWI